MFEIEAKWANINQPVAVKGVQKMSSLMRLFVAVFATFSMNLPAYADKIIPPIFGLPEADAVKAIEDLGLVAEVGNGNLSMNKIGTVVSSNPLPGEKVSNGSKVTINSSIGIFIADYFNQPADTARSELTSRGFTVKTEPVTIKPIASGLIASQIPQANQLFDATMTSVVLGESTGPTTSVPDQLVEQTLADGLGKISNADLIGKVVSGPESGGNYPWGCGTGGMCVSCRWEPVITGTNPSSGTAAWPRDIVQLTTRARGTSNCMKAPGLCKPNGSCVLF